jgi:hypothetical protein
MKAKHPITLALVLITSLTFGQSKSFVSLKEQFKGKQDVHSFTVGSFFVNLVLQLADEDDEIDFDAIKNIGSIHLITIPKQHFEGNKLSLDGYKRFIQKEDAYEELIHVNDKGERVTLFMKTMGSKENRYLILFDQGDDLTAIEFKGYVEVNEFFKDSKIQCSSI